MLSAKGGGGAAKGKYAWLKTNADRSKIEIVTNNNPAKYPDNGMLENNYYKKIKEYKLGEFWQTYKIDDMDVQNILYGNGVYLLANANEVYYSLDGMIWTNISASTSQKIFFANGIFIRFFTNYTNNYPPCYSVDGKNWTTINLYSTISQNMEIRDVAYGNGLFIMVGHPDSNSTPIIVSSDNCKTWKKVAKPNYSLEQIRYENGIWVALSSEVEILYSVNGTSWVATGKRVNATRSTPTIRYANGVWMVTQSEGSNIGLSKDGKSWTVINANEHWIKFFDYLNGKYLFVGWEYNNLSYLCELNLTDNAITQIKYIDMKSVYKYEDGYLGVGKSNIGLFYSTDLQNWEKINEKNFSNLFYVNKTLFADIQSMNWTQHLLTKPVFYADL